MRALLYTGEGRIGIRNDVRVRDQGPGEVIVNIHACGLCRMPSRAGKTKKAREDALTA